MSDVAITNLLRQAPFSFVGTIEHLSAATMSNIAIGARTAVVRVDYVLHAPPAFAGLRGQRITVQLADDREPPAVGESAAFFAQGLAFGESIAVAEVGRLPVDAVMGHITQALEAGQAGGAFDTILSQLEMERLRTHADSADAVVVGRVIKLDRAFNPTPAEHDPDWWKATLDVNHVEKGAVTAGELVVLYANSLDVQWRTAPKPKASQEGLWLLHATEGKLRAAAAFVILHPEDFQPIQNLNTLRGMEVE
jgi:hypothetical protein